MSFSGRVKRGSKGGLPATLKESCIEERVSATSDEKFIPTPRGVYVHGLGLDEVLQLRSRIITVEADVDGVDDGDDEITVADEGYADNALVGETLAIWDAAKTKKPQGRGQCP